MSKYRFHRMGGENFQQMVQALLEKGRRESGNLIQFSSVGADGGREATWTQYPSHPEYIKRDNTNNDQPRQWVFQVKFHDVGHRGWDGAADAVIADLKSELDKLVNKHSVPCDHYVLITNVPLTGARRIGSRDKVTKIAAAWSNRIPAVEVWDAADLSRMLDNNSDVRSGYSELILPGDVLTAIYNHTNFQANRRESVFQGFLHHIVNHESKARAEEAGDDDPLSLTKVFIDQKLTLNRDFIPESCKDLVRYWDTESSASTVGSALPESFDDVASSFPILWGAQEKIMLLAGPGYGKSTITQFFALYHASRLVNRSNLPALTNRLQLPTNWKTEQLDSMCTLRFPLRIELRRYTKWRRNQDEASGLASYIAKQLIGTVVESNLSQDDIFGFIAENPTILMLDGLDEVPNKSDRDQLLDDFDAFLNRCSGEDVDLQIIMSSRPQGYNGEFDRFQPLRWTINDLDRTSFDAYCAAWLSERIRTAEERSEAEDRINRGMLSEAVCELASTLLQATVMLTIVRRKIDIPEERYALFERYVDVVFQREKNKSDLISNYERELRLLHEIVGYEIHEGVAHGREVTLPDREFRNLVLEVWRVMRGDLRFDGILNQELERVYELATDRLVFLSGKGKDQSDIDFVVQPYREYFAAAFLANDVLADSQKIFENLVKRGPYWQQVLRFYVATSSPAQQLAWAMLASNPGHYQSVDEFATSIQTKRSILFCLPEFSRFQFAHVQKTIRGLLPPIELWTWIGQDWCIPILINAKNGDAWRELWSAVVKRPEEVEGYPVTLKTFPVAIQKCSSEYPAMVTWLKALMRNPATAFDACFAAVANDVEVDFDGIDESILFRAIRDVVYSSGSKLFREEQLLKRLSDSQVVRYFCAGLHRMRSAEEFNAIFELFNLPIRVSNLQLWHSDTSAPVVLHISKPTWIQPYLNGKRESKIASPPSGGHYSDYIEAVRASLGNIYDAQADQRARELHDKLPESPTWFLSPEYMLGPKSSEFDSPAIWEEFKRRMSIVFDLPEELESLRDIATTLSQSKISNSHTWVILLFHPTNWDQLVIAGLFQEQFIRELLNREWPKIALMRQEFTPWVEAIHYEDQVFVDTPVINIFRAVVALHNAGTLVDSSLAPELAKFMDVSRVTADDIHALLSTVKDVDLLPEHWGNALIEVALSVDGVDLVHVVEFWAQMTKHGRSGHWLDNRDFTKEKLSSIISKLAEIGYSGLKLALTMSWGYRTVDEATSRRVHSLVIKRLKDSVFPESDLALLARSIHRAFPSIEEVELISDINIFKHVSAAIPGWATEIADRIKKIPELVSKSEFGRLQAVLRGLVSRREVYGDEIGAAALDGLVRVSFINCAPLSKSDWRNG